VRVDLHHMRVEDLLRRIREAKEREATVEQASALLADAQASLDRALIAP
jgi:hypothetical protein